MRRSSCGTTLIEIIVAVVIFGVLMLSGMSFFSLANQSQAKASKLIKATELCNSVMEQGKAGGLTNYTTVIDTGHDGAFYVTTEVNRVPQPPNAQPYSLTNCERIVHVSVTWADQGASVVDMYTIFTTIVMF